MRIILLLCAVAITCKTYASEQCIDEKEKADYWNEKLLERVDEYRRDRHRAAKSEYLECLRQPKSPKQDQVRSNTPKSVKTNPYKNRVQFSKNITVSAFANFKGAKRDAWLTFYKESNRCIKNKTDMTLFVECSEVRKRHLVEFESRWDESAQSLTPLIK